jgi:multidrug efflux system outer membrane protein
MSNVLFQSARTYYMQVLLMRRDALGGEMELVETPSCQMQARLHMDQALGGGWR